MISSRTVLTKRFSLPGQIGPTCALRSCGEVATASTKIQSRFSRYCETIQLKQRPRNYATHRKEYVN